MNIEQAWQELQSLDAQNPGVWPNWVKVAAAILLTVALVGAGYYFLIMPKTEELKGLQSTEKTLREQFEFKQRKVAALDAYKEQLREMERTFGDMLRQLPSKAEVANLITDISQTRVASGLEEQLFQPQGQVPKEFYAEIPNKIVVIGNYHELATFASNVAALPRIVTIQEVQIDVIGKSNRTEDNIQEGDLRMTALAKTYRYLDDDELAAQQEAAKPAGGRR